MSLTGSPMKLRALAARPWPCVVPRISLQFEVRPRLPLLCLTPFELFQLKAELGLPVDETKYDTEERQALATFTAFQRTVQNLDHELQDLIASVIPLGASVAVLWSSWRMREQLAATLSVINAAAKQRCPPVSHLGNMKLDSEALRMILPFNISLPSYIRSNEVHTELSNLAGHIDAFFGCLQEFTGYVDGSITEAVTLIRDDLKFIAHRVQEAKEQSGNVSLAGEVFIHDITPDIGSRLEGLTKAISSVKDGSLVSLKFTHEHAVSNFTSMATIATFLSAVIATVLALPHNPHSSFSDALTSGSWLISLVLSISSAFHSVWAASWQQAVYRFPNARVPPFVRSWMLHAPICLLLSSVAVFCAGLVFYAISSQPKWVIVAVTFVLGLCTIGFTVCAAWFLLEFAAYFRYKGEFHHDMWSFIGLKWGNGSPPHLVTDGLVVQLPTETNAPQTLLPRTPSQDSTARKKFIRFVRFIIGLQRDGIGPQHAGQPISLPRDPRLLSSYSTLNLSAVPQAQLAQAVRVVASKTAQYLPIMRVGFSPDGHRLTSTSIDGNTYVFAMPHLSVTDLTRPRKVSGQPLWSPDGSRLAIRKGSRILIYCRDSDASPRLLSRRPELTVVRPSTVKSVSWFPDSQAFISIEDTGAVKISNMGDEVESYKISDVVWHAAGVLHGGNIIFLAAAPKNCMPSTACAQNYIIVYDPRAEIRHRVLIKIPIAQKAIDLSLSEDCRWVLVSYEGKVPPQLFHWHYDSGTRTNRLTRKRTFVPTHDGAFAGPCVLSGKADKFVLGATRSGDIYIWDLKGTLLRRIEAEKDSPGISCIAGSRSHDGCTFATGSLDGTVRFWQGLDPDPGSMRTDHPMTVPLPPVDQRSGLADVETISPTLIAASGHQRPENDEGPVAGLGLSV